MNTVDDNQIKPMRLYRPLEAADGGTTSCRRWGRSPYPTSWWRSCPTGATRPEAAWTSMPSSNGQLTRSPSWSWATTSSTRDVAHAAQGPSGSDGGHVPSCVGFPGHGVLKTSAGKQDRASRLDCSTSVLWEQVPTTMAGARTRSHWLTCGVPAWFSTSATWGSFSTPGKGLTTVTSLPAHV